MELFPARPVPEQMPSSTNLTLSTPKDISEVTACVVDFGMFMPVAQTLGKQAKKVYYHTPTEKGFQVIDDFVMGGGVKGIKRIDDYFKHEVYDEIDLFVFPYILYGGLQDHLRRCGKAVWGAGHADELERMKGTFYDSLKEAGLEVPPHEEIMGMTALRKHLKERENVFIKMDKFRGTMDTWKHRNYLESRDYLDRLTCKLGPFQERILFYVLEEIKTPIEGGIDTYCIDGQWPQTAVLGYENKNETYLAVVKPMDELPEVFTKVNKAYTPILERYGYRQFFSTEVRVKDGVSYFIDPTCRTASPAGEEMLDLFGNMGEIMWRGAQGELVQPEITHQCAGEAYIHWTGGKEGWKCLPIPKEFRDRVKIYASAYVDGVFWSPPDDEDVIGCIVGLGDTPEEVIDSIKESIEALGEAPISVNTASFVDLIKEIESAQEQGIEFCSEALPRPATVVEA
jgi:hypothetical protein